MSYSKTFLRRVDNVDRKERGRLPIDKRPKSREETPKEGISGKLLPHCNNMHVRRKKGK